MVLKDIKLIIWDMDNTFYEGTLEQDTIQITNDRKELINNLIEIGIQNSICSKNEYQELKKILVENGLWDEFILPVINLENKKDNIKYIIDNLHIQPKNVLFIDDSIYNREEVKYYLPELNVQDITIIPKILKEICTIEKKDIQRKAYKNYKMLEKKIHGKQKFTNNYEFLRKSNIMVQIHKDCKSQLDRIYELGRKTNQLNFTKRRLNKIELLNLVEDNTFETAYIIVSDKYGDYGVVGFYSLKEGVLYDFYFSCRIMGMYVEQYIYAVLKFPEICICSDIRVPLKANWIPDWFNKSTNGVHEFSIIKEQAKILIRGECDMKQMINYIGDENVYGEFDRENCDVGFNHIYNMHTEILVQSILYSESKLNSIIETACNYDCDTFNFSIFKKKFDIILFSFSSDIRQGMYKNRITGDIIIAGDYLYPLDRSENLEDIYVKSRIRFTKESYEDFNKTFKYLGAITKDRFSYNLNIIRKSIAPTTKFVFVKYLPYKVRGDKGDRIEHIEKLNEVIEKFCKIKNNNSYILDLSEIITSVSDYSLDNLHFKRIIYYKIATKFSNIINELNYKKLKIPKYISCLI